MMDVHRRSRALLLGAVLLAALSGAPPSNAAEPPKEQKAPPRGPQKGLPPPSYLSQGMYELLHGRMQRHAETMNRLLSPVVLLRYEEVIAAAERIATDRGLVKPQPGEMSDVEVVLPSRFYLLQDQLQDRARAVTDAARARDDGKLAAAFGRLTEACVACHAAYRSEAPPPRPRAR